MKIFFTASIRGGRKGQDFYPKILEQLRRHGEILNEHVGDEQMSTFGETELSSEEIVKREMNRLVQCDLVVAEVTTPSFGVGFLIAEALRLKKPVYGLFHGKNTDALSAFIKGHKVIRVATYRNEDDLSRVLEEIRAPR